MVLFRRAAVAGQRVHARLAGAPAPHVCRSAQPGRHVCARMVSVCARLARHARGAAVSVSVAVVFVAACFRTAPQCCMSGHETRRGVLACCLPELVMP